VTVQTYKWIIGNAWGLPSGMTGPEHYWTYAGGNEWKTICDRLTIQKMEEFSGLGSITLTFEHNPVKHNRCDECSPLFLETDYGKKHGIKPPYIKDDRENE
jgi:hypothetical protein